MEESIKQKQKYIKNNIIDKGYNKDKFMIYLSNKKGEIPINLNNISIQELINLCNEFIQNNINDKKEDEKYINCELIEETLISKQNNIEIKVSSPQVEKKGIFSFSYSTYLLKTTPLNVEVRRRYSDFIWLYNILKNQFPNCVIPPFFKKKEKLDKNIMDKRITYIEYFLNDIAIHPLLRNTKVFYDFVSMDENEFSKIKNNYEKIESPSNVKSFKSLNGEIKVTISYDKEKYFQNIKQKFSSEENIFDKLIINYKALINNIQLTSQKMKDISKIWEELYNLKNIYSESECTTGAYSSIIKTMNEWANFQNNYCTLIKDSIVKFLKYFKQEYISFINLYPNVEKYKYNYNKKQQKLISAKEQLFQNENNGKKDESEKYKEKEKKKEIEISKIFLEDSEKLTEIENEYGCYLNSYIEEFERIIDTHSIKMKKYSFKYVKELATKISNFNFTLSEIMGYIDTLPEEGYIANNIINNELYNNAVPVAGNII